MSFHMGLELSPTRYVTMADDEIRKYLAKVLHDLVDNYVRLAPPALLETFMYKTTRTSLEIKEKA